MDKREVFDALDGFSQNILMTLAEVEALKKQLQKIVDENTNLRLENAKLRERLEQLTPETHASSSSQGRLSLEKIHQDGFHVCTDFYGQRLDNDETCLMCDELLYRD